MSPNSRERPGAARHALSGLLIACLFLASACAKEPTAGAGLKSEQAPPESPPRRFGDAINIPAIELSESAFLFAYAPERRHTEAPLDETITLRVGGPHFGYYLSRRSIEGELVEDVYDPSDQVLGKRILSHLSPNGGGRSGYAELTPIPEGFEVRFPTGFSGAYKKLPGGGLRVEWENGWFEEYYPDGTSLIQEEGQRYHGALRGTEWGPEYSERADSDPEGNGERFYDVQFEKSRMRFEIGIVEPFGIGFMEYGDWSFKGDAGLESLVLIDLILRSRDLRFTPIFALEYLGKLTPPEK